MDTKQQECLDALQQGNNVFLTGPAGTGKSYTVQHVADRFEARGKKVALTAMTGCAALLLSPKARTLHSWAGIGLGREDVSVLVERARKNRQALERWRTTDLLIIDEVSMLGPTLFEKLEAVARKLRRRDTFFGGLCVLLVGDFYQLPPVDEETFLFQSPVFRRGFSRVVSLETVYRQKSDQEWYDVLQNIRKGQLTDRDATLLHGRLVDKTTTMIPEAMTVLYPVNRKVDALNDNALSCLEGIREYPVRVVKGVKVRESDVEATRQRMGVATAFRVAKGARVLLTWNMDLEAGLVNGSQGVVVGFSRRGWPLVRFANNENDVEIEPKEYTEDDDDADEDFRWSVYQIPLKLAWALSIHKVQGHNLDAALMDLGSHVFECGQAYVALSRIKTLEGVYLSSLDAARIRAHPAVVEYYSLL